MFRRCEDEKMFYTFPLLEEPCAQTLGKNALLTFSVLITTQRLETFTIYNLPYAQIQNFPPIHIHQLANLFCNIVINIDKEGIVPFWNDWKMLIKVLNDTQ